MTSISAPSQDPAFETRLDAPSRPTSLARRLILAGDVQGLGVRPAIFRLATELGLGGTVWNSSRGVEIEVEGPKRALDVFESSLPRALPAAARLLQVSFETIQPQNRDAFTIVTDPSDGPVFTRVPEDRTVCPECLREIGQPGDRRRGYAFTSCTLCGPRYTVIRSMPFERDDTAMDRFPLCSECRREFERPRDRRFHAQTMACPTCGPQIWSEGTEHCGRLQGREALKEAVRTLKAGRIVALRGLGGYQLLVDATNGAAVERLRERKGRRAKPLAVMVRSIEAAERLAYLDATETAALLEATGPILLARSRPNNGLTSAIHPQFDTVGLLLPTMPLHSLLANRIGRPLVCTSGNREGDPLEYEVALAVPELSGLCDLWLHHNREIVRPIDDSVVRVIARRRVTMRAARGLAPLPLDLPPMRPIIAVGGYLKAAAAWSNGSQAVLGPHIGDQQSLPSRERFLAHLADVQRLYRFRPEQIVHDLHPEYFSTQWAQQQGIPTLAVQHHHAHVVAGMLEHDWLDRPVLGVAWDGTGYGTDGTIWGGEFLTCSAKSFERVARLRPFRLPGGEAAIHEPWRIAASVCSQIDRSIDLKRWPGWNVTDHHIGSIERIIDRPQLSPLTSSAGRLIDAAASLILGMDHADFDGQAAMRLEAAADCGAKGWYEFPLSEGDLLELDWRPLFAGLLVDVRLGVDAGTMAMRFHRSLAHGIVRVCRHWPELPVVVSGGVFQNRVLTELVVEMHHGKSQPLGLPGSIPPNDGGLAAGQLAIAAAQEGFVPCV